MKPLQISFAGTGNLSWHLSEAFFKAGHRIVEFAARDLAKATAYANRVEALPLGSPSLLNPRVDLIVLALSDEAIVPVAQRIPTGTAVLVHCSGALPILDLPKSKSGVLYPFQTFRKEKPIRWENIPLFVEGSDMESTSLLFDLASQISLEVSLLQSPNRAMLHLAGVFASNFANFAWLLAEDFCRKAGLNPALIQPLIEETWAKSKALGTATAMTGPALRHDQNTLDRHRELLRQEPELLALYVLISQAIQKRFPK